MIERALVAAVLLGASSLAAAATASATLVGTPQLSLIDLDSTDRITPYQRPDYDLSVQRWDTYGQTIVSDGNPEISGTAGLLQHDVGRWEISPMTTAILSGSATTFGEGAAGTWAYGEVSISLTGYRGAQRDDGLPSFRLIAGRTAAGPSAFEENRSSDFSLAFVNDTALPGYLAYTSLEQRTWNNGHPSVSPVPEPESFVYLLAGLGVLGFVSRRRRPGKGARL